MRSPDDILAKLGARWSRNWVDWAAGSGVWPWTLNLDPPTEAMARNDWEGFDGWRQAWRCSTIGGVQRDERQWRSFGAQEIPTRVVLHAPEQVAAALGDHWPETFSRARSRWDEVARRWPQALANWPRFGALVAGMSSADFDRAGKVVDWLLAHPDSGFYLRQLPIAGIDSKFAEQNAEAIKRVLAGALGVPESGTLHALAGLRTDPPRFRIRLLCPELRRRVAGLSDLSLGLPELACLDNHLSAKLALVVENQQTALACGDMPGVILLMGGGFGVTALDQVQWLHDLPMLYWGDIDTAGFEILNGLRSHFPRVQSILMDEGTLLAHHDLWSQDPAQRATFLPALTEAERKLHHELHSGRWGRLVRSRNALLGTMHGIWLRTPPVK